MELKKVLCSFTQPVDANATILDYLVIPAFRLLGWFAHYVISYPGIIYLPWLSCILNTRLFIWVAGVSISLPNLVITTCPSS